MPLFREWPLSLHSYMRDIRDSSCMFVCVNCNHCDWCFLCPPPPCCILRIHYGNFLYGLTTDMLPPRNRTKVTCNSAVPVYKVKFVILCLLKLSPHLTRYDNSNSTNTGFFSIQTETPENFWQKTLIVNCWCRLVLVPAWLARWRDIIVSSHVSGKNMPGAFSGGVTITSTSACVSRIYRRLMKFYMWFLYTPLHVLN